MCWSHIGDAVRRYTPVWRYPSCPKLSHLSEGTPAVRRYPSCPKLSQLSEVTPAVRSYPGCPKLPQLSKGTPAVQRYPSCPKVPQLSEVTPAVRKVTTPVRRYPSLMVHDYQSSILTSKFSCDVKTQEPRFEPIPTIDFQQFWSIFNNSDHRFSSPNRTSITSASCSSHWNARCVS